ncbi:DUF2786 domain-containing protein [Marinomonas epiphytica]
MSISRRKKAIQKVVKLLNLATSSNSSESNVALRHAESLIAQYSIAQRELPILQLCDRSMLYKVSWGSAARKFTNKPSQKKATANASVFQRRFSEKTTTQPNNDAMDPATAYASAKTILDDLEPQPEMAEKDVAPETVVSGQVNTESEQDSVQEAVSEAGSSADAGAFANADNVINATSAFRANGAKPSAGSSETPSTSQEDFDSNSYWQKVKQKLSSFDEEKTQAELDSLTVQLALAKENLESKRQQRALKEQEEVEERVERARIEQSFEEAMEKAFLARAQAYEAWENECSKIRMACLQEEQEAIEGFESVHQAMRAQQDSLDHYQKSREEYRVAKMMHELRTHLSVVAEGQDNAVHSYRQVLTLLAENSLSLKDLEFSDIKNKSLFIRLLERESALIKDVEERERFTEQMLEKFLTGKTAFDAGKQTHTLNPLQRIHQLLMSANEGEAFESQKSLEQVIHLMEAHSLTVRDIGFDHIQKYSVFIRLINWQAGRIASLAEREQFTTGILEEYVQHSLNKNGAEQQQKAN